MAASEPETSDSRPTTTPAFPALRIFTRYRALPYLLILALILAVRLVLIGIVPLADTSEPRYAEIARLMAATGDWITPWFEPGVPFWGKPPFAFWMSALSFKLFGVNEFAARFPVWISTLATLALIFRFARSQFDRRAAWLAVLIYASSLLPFIAAGAVLTDPYFALAITLSLVPFGEPPQSRGVIWKYGFFVGLALGMLSKGPFALVLVGAVVGIWAAIYPKEALYRLRSLPWGRGIMLFMALSLPWYIAAELKTPGFLKYFIIGEHFYRFTDPGWQGDLYGTAHRRVYGSILVDWMVATFPWSLVALWHLARAMMKDGRPSWPTRRHLPPWTAFLVMWALAAPAFFLFSGNILWTYVLPSLPPFAVLMASRLSRENRADTLRRFRGVTALVPAATMLLGVAFAVFPDIRNTEKGLIAYYNAHAKAGEPLYYLDERPFSARYYSQASAQLHHGEFTRQFFDAHPYGVYLAFRDALPRLPDGIVASPVLFKNRRYSLVYVNRAPPPHQEPMKRKE